MEHHETPSRRPRDASLARASLSPSRAAVIKSMQHSSKNQPRARTSSYQLVPARTSSYQLVNTVYPYDWRVRTFGYRPSQESLKPNRSDGSVDRTEPDRSNPIDRTRSMTDPTRVPPRVRRRVPGARGVTTRRVDRAGRRLHHGASCERERANAMYRRRGTRRGTSRAMTTRMRRGMMDDARDKDGDERERERD